MEVKIGIGLDDLVFGMSAKDVKNILGTPDRISETEKTEGIVYYYNDLFIKTKFDLNEDGKMYSIEVFNAEAILLDQIVMGKKKDEILSFLKSKGYCTFEEDDYEFFETLLCEEIWCTFTFEFNRLRSFEFSPLSDENENNIWPDRSVWDAS